MKTLPPWIVKWWDVANDRRGRLIVKKHQGVGLTKAQEEELVLLQQVADAIITYVSPAREPKSIKAMDKMIAKYFPELA